MNNDPKKIHNIVSSVVLADAMRHLRTEFMVSIRGYLRMNDSDADLLLRAEHAARRAMEAVLQENPAAFLQAATADIEELVSSTISDNSKQLTLKNVRHTVDMTCTPLEMIFRRVYVHENELFLEHTGYLAPDENPSPEEIFADLVTDLDFHELESLACAVMQGSYEVENLKVGRDCNGRELKLGDKVRWHDPAIADFKGEERQIQENRVWTVTGICGDIVKIQDDPSEADVYDNELETVEP